MSVEAMVIAAHPGDAEFGMGGTIAALTAAGHRVVLVDFSDRPQGADPAEPTAAAEVLGVTERVSLGLTSGAVLDSVENRRRLAALMRQYQPRVLYVPYWEDADADHVEVALIAQKARLYARLEKSDLPFEAHFARRVFHYPSWRRRSDFHPSFVFDISDALGRKVEALQRYQQSLSSIGDGEAIVGQMVDESAYWGGLVGRAHGEPFISREHLCLSTIETLLDV